MVKYAMGGINAKVRASEYLTVLPSEKELLSAIERAKLALAPASDPLHRN